LGLWKRSNATMMLILPEPRFNRSSYEDCLMVKVLKLVMIFHTDLMEGKRSF